MGAANIPRNVGGLEMEFCGFQAAPKKGEFYYE
jgi:hypothetical protein